MLGWGGEGEGGVSKDIHSFLIQSAQFFPSYLIREPLVGEQEIEQLRFGAIAAFIPPSIFRVKIAIQIRPFDPFALVLV